MKITHNIFLIVFAVCLVGLISGPVHGQKKAINQREYFGSVYGTPKVPLSERPHRIESIQEELTDGTVTKSTTIVSESLPPDRYRYFSKTIENGKTTEYESITIGHFEYSRRDGRSWTKIDLREQASSTGAASTGGGSISCTQYLVEAVVLNGIPLRLYEMVEVTSVDNLLTFREAKKWITEEGLPYREEAVKGTLSPRLEKWRNTTTYDYLADIKIEAPSN